MRVIIQRVNEAKVVVDENVVSSINKGYLLLVGFTNNDSLKDINYLVDKIKFLRLFDDNNGIMNLDINTINGSILSVSQFTLYADTSKGRRPSYIKALKYEDAKELYNKFNEVLRANDLNVETGIFGAEMKVSLINDGPVTIIVDSKDGLYE